MNQHTPGPWLYRGKSEAVYTAPPEGSVYQYGEQIFRFNEDALPSDADHYLILAAPELLAALNTLVQYVVDGAKGDHLEGAVRTAERAITKAKGGAL